MVKTATFNGVKFEIDIKDPVDGLCSYPHEKQPHIHLLIDLSTRRGLEVAIHEGLHAEGWAKGEEVVERTAKEIARFLWRLGFRYVQGDEK